MKSEKKYRYLPHKQEPLEDLQKRVYFALEPLFDPADLSTFPDESEDFRPHTFDFDDGLRLVLLREKVVLRDGSEGVALRVKPTIEVESPLDTFYTNSARDQDKFYRHAWKQLWALFKDEKPFEPPNHGIGWRFLIQGE